MRDMQPGTAAPMNFNEDIFFPKGKLKLFNSLTFVFYRLHSMHYHSICDNKKEPANKGIFDSFYICLPCFIGKTRMNEIDTVPWRDTS